MTDYVIAIRHGDRLTYYRDQWGRYWSNEEGLKRAERYPSLESARRVVQCQFPGHRKRMAVIPLSSEMLARGDRPSSNVVPPCGDAHG
jgi:hypothetical protein